MTRKKVHIIGGGTVSHVRSHFALSAPAYGETARRLDKLCRNFDKYEVQLHLTKMASAGVSPLETNGDIANLVDRIVTEDSTKMIIFNPCLVDYNGTILDNSQPTISGKYAARLQSRKESPLIQLSPADKIISRIRQERKDIYVVGFKTTTGATEDEQYLAGLNLLKSSSINLVLANDTLARRNMIITPEEARYHVTTNRNEALQNLIEIAYLRSDLTFTRSTVVEGDPVSWNSLLVPANLRTVVNYCIQNGAYKPFRGSTAGHFAIKIDEGQFLTSRRKKNFNDLNNVGLVRVESNGPDSVIAYGSRPSVGGQSQRIIFAEHPEYNSIVHFHCPIKLGSNVPVVSQRPYECGSHECGQNTSSGLQPFGELSAVMLDNHGPNIVFNHTADPQYIIRFIDDNFDLSKKTGGLVSIPENISL